MWDPKPRRMQNARPIAVHGTPLPAEYAQGYPSQAAAQSLVNCTKTPPREEHSMMRPKQCLPRFLKQIGPVPAALIFQAEPSLPRGVISGKLPHPTPAAQPPGRGRQRWNGRLPSGHAPHPPPRAVLRGAGLQQQRHQPAARAGGVEWYIKMFFSVHFAANWVPVH